jgi:hypothetical protein
MDTVLFVIGALIALIALGALFAAESKAAGVTAFVGGALVAAICFGLAFTYRLGANEVGVQITFGKIGTVEGPGGLHSKAPWTDVQKMTVYPFTANPIDYTLRNKDGGEFAARFQPRWHTDADHAVALYKQHRTSDEQQVTDKVVNPLLSGVASDTAKVLRNENVLSPDGKTVVEEGVATMSTLTFAKRVQDALAPKLAEKGIILDEIAILGDWSLSDAMRAQLASLAASKARTQVAQQDAVTAQAEVAAAKARAGAAGNIPALTQQQVQVYCANVWRDEVRRATEKGVPVYTVPCGDSSGAGVLVGAAK